MKQNLTIEHPTPPSDLTKRLGRFRIARTFFLNCPETLQPLFAKMIVLEAQLHWEKDSIEYLAMSNHFEIVPETTLAPFYDIIFHQNSNELTFEFTKRFN